MRVSARFAEGRCRGVNRKLIIQTVNAALGKGGQHITVYDDSVSIWPFTESGTWKQISPARIYECSVCRQNVMTDDIGAYKYCHGCGAKMEGVE